MAKKTIADVKIKDKTVLIRVDFNVPLKDGKITDDTRIVAALPTIKYAIDKGAKIVLFSHLGRVKTQEDLKTYSLRVVADRLAELLNQKVYFVPSTRGKELETKVASLKPGEVLMVENTRFEDLDGKKESKNDHDLGKYWASLGEIFVNDAFGTAHRAHASNLGISTFIKKTVAGLLLDKEIKFIGKAISNPDRPLVAVLGGAKVSDKIEVIKNLLNVADKVLIGGGMVFTFLKAQGYEIGKSLVELDKVDLAKELLELGKGKLVLGTDVACGKEFSPETTKEFYDFASIPEDQMGLDIGPKTIKIFEDELAKAKTVIWNGPMGVFEFDKFVDGTKAVAKAIAGLKDKAVTIIGGGDSIAAIAKFELENEYSHISTGGGASLEYLEGKILPGIECVTHE